MIAEEDICHIVNNALRLEYIGKVCRKIPTSLAVAALALAALALAALSLASLDNETKLQECVKSLKDGGSTTATVSIVYFAITLSQV